VPLKPAKRTQFKKNQRCPVSQHEDKTFIKHFSMIIAGLVVFTLVIATLAYNIHTGLDRGETSLREQRESERIAPVGAVSSDAAPLPGAAADAAPPVVVQTVAETPPFDAEGTYKSVCFACHDTGAADAPKLEPEFWTDRLAKGEEALVSSAINGIGMMPAKGGRMDLTDDQVAAIVAYMISRVEQ
jgi:cytochrome c5